MVDNERGRGRGVKEEGQEEEEEEVVVVVEEERKRWWRRRRRMGGNKKWRTRIGKRERGRETRNRKRGDKLHPILRNVVNSSDCQALHVDTSMASHTTDINTAQIKTGAVIVLTKCLHTSLAILKAFTYFKQPTKNSVTVLTSNNEVSIRKYALCLHEHSGMAVVEQVKDAISIHPDWLLCPLQSLLIRVSLSPGPHEQRGKIVS